MKFLIINGPNINMLGIREKSIYGTDSYKTLSNSIRQWGEELGVETKVTQTNHEGDIIDKIQDAMGEYDGLIINAGGYTHTSIAIMDAVKAVMIPTVEVHITDISQREDFRKISYIGMASVTSVMGKGILGYREAMEYLINYLSK